MRRAVAHPERVRAIIVQNAVAHEDGLGPAWDFRRAFWKDRAAYEDKVIPGFTSLEGAKARHLGSSPHPDRYDPETWDWEAALLSRPGQRQIQSESVLRLSDQRRGLSVLAGLAQRPSPAAVALAEAQAYQRDVPDAAGWVNEFGNALLARSDHRADGPRRAGSRVWHHPRPRRRRVAARGTANSHASRPPARVGAAGAHNGARRAGDRSYRGSHLEANSVVNWFVALFKELGYEGCSSHSGRRSFIAMATAAACATCSCSRAIARSKRRNATSTATPARRCD